MKDKKSLFGTQPRHVDQLVSHILKQSADDEACDVPDLLQVDVEHSETWIGPYRLRKLLGQGGMGLVYLAQQQHPIRRSVALKVIKPGMDSARVLARFDAERQALARLDHPNIAHVLDAGATDAGRPFFVMEYVEGVPITDYCDDNRLGLEQRLDLFRQVCQGVHHAHQRGIIHRDIKPSNILVAAWDGQAVPKIIDFGVAKAVNQPLTEHTLSTEPGQLFGTPEYMSPEQADLASEDIDVRSDVYSLGVLLYVMLTGVLPFDADTLRTGGLERIRQVICHTDPQTPSTRLTDLQAEARAIAANRQTDVGALRRRLQQELEWIPIKALRKERAERYQSAAELALDVDNYLKGAALIAGPPGVLYRLKKFTRRNRVLVTAALAVLLALTAGAVVSTVFAMRAEQQAGRFRVISDYLSNVIIGAVDPFKGRQRGRSLDALPDIAAEGLAERFTRQPLVEAFVRHTLGQTYMNLGKYEPAEDNLKQAVALRKAHLGLKALETLLSMRELGWLYYEQGRYSESEVVLAEALKGMRRTLGEVDPRRLETASRLAWIYLNLGRYKEAERLQTEALHAIQRKLGPDHPYLPNHMEGLAAAYEKQERVEEAAELWRQALDISRRHPDPDHEETINITKSYGELCEKRGRFDEAENLYLQVVRAWQRRYGNEHPKTLMAQCALDRVYRKLKRFSEAREHLESAREISRAALGKTDPRTLVLVIEMAKLHGDQGDKPKAEQMLLSAEKDARQALGPGHPVTKMCIRALIQLYEAWGKPDQVEVWQAKLSPGKAEPAPKPGR